MTRIGRLVAPGMPHHVICRGNNRRRIFSSSSDFELFLWLLARASQRFDCQVHALALMTNHVHAILTPPDAAALAGCVKGFSQRYAQERNRDREASGKLFEERYLRFPVLADRQLGVTTSYIELNPVRAGVVAAPEEYRWSTHRLHAGMLDASCVPAAMWTPSPWYLGLGGSPTARAERYRDWVAAHQGLEGEPERVTRIQAAEALSAPRYARRLRRPDGTCACEPVARYGRKVDPR
ncbi:MAG TPA: transposase [Gemmatimonadaceae bacterium]